MANSPTDPFDNQLDQLARLFRQDLLNDIEESRWPGRIDFVARRVAESQYPVGMTSQERKYIDSGPQLDDAAHEHYCKGLAALADNPSLRTALPDGFDIGTFLVEFAKLRQGLKQADVELPPGEVLGRIITRDIKRRHSGKQAQLAQRLPADVETPQELMMQLSELPELAAQVQGALPDTNDPESLTDQLGEINLTTELWDHQLEALALWLYHGMNAYVDMATATGKTVLGLAAVAHAVDTDSDSSEKSLGSLHPTDQKRLNKIFGDMDGGVPRPNRERPRNALIVTTDSLLGAQWARLFQEHCQTPPQYTKVEDRTITLPRMEIDIRSADSLDDVDPRDYRVAVFDEVHNYTDSDGWGGPLRAFIESSCPVLALTGSVTDEFEKLAESADADFYAVYRYTHKLALSDGVIPDFEWTLSFTSVRNEGDVLKRVRKTAQLANSRLVYYPPNFRLASGRLANTDPKLSEQQRSTLVGSYETGLQVADALREIGDDDAGTAPTDELETLAHGLENRTLDRLNLQAQLNRVEELAEEALADERPVLILTRSYPEAKELWQRLYERNSERFVQRIEQEETPTEQDTTIENFDKKDTRRKVLIGPGERIGQGSDIHSVEVGINLSRPGSGVNATLVQRLGRLLRDAGGKNSVKFYHVLGVLPEDALIGPDSESFVRTVAEFFAQVLEPDTDGILKTPHVKIDEAVRRDIVALERMGAPAVKRAEQPTKVELAYAEAVVTESDVESEPVVASDWFAEAFDAAAGATDRPEIDRQSDATLDDSPDGDPTGENPSMETDTQLIDSDEMTDDIDVTTPTQELGPDAETVEVDSGIVALVALTASIDENEYDSTGSIVEAALTPFLKSTVGTAFDPGKFTFTSEREFSFTCDPVLEQLFQVRIAMDDQHETRDDLVHTALYEAVGLDDVEGELAVPGYERFRLNIEALVENDDCACETPGEVVQVALEEFFDIE